MTDNALPTDYTNAVLLAQQWQQRAVELEREIVRPREERDRSEEAQHQLLLAVTERAARGEERLAWVLSKCSVCITHHVEWDGATAATCVQVQSIADIDRLRGATT